MMDDRLRRSARYALAKLLPDASSIGDPYWVLMEIQRGSLTGSMWALDQAGQRFLPLFLSRLTAEKARSQLPDGRDFVVRGLSATAWSATAALLASTNTSPVLVTDVETTTGQMTTRRVDLPNTRPV